MRRRLVLQMLIAMLALGLTSPARAWFGWSLPYFVYDASRFAQQTRAVQAELQWIESVYRHLENDVRMLKSMRYSNLGDLQAGLQRLESAAARVDKLTDEPERMGDLIARDWPIDWKGSPDDDDRYATTRDRWVSRERQTLADVRGVQNAVAMDMARGRNRVGSLITESNNAGGLTEALQARTQLHGELSSELAKLQMLRATRAAMRSERSAREASEAALSKSVADWLYRDDGVREPATVRGRRSESSLREPSIHKQGGQP